MFPDYWHSIESLICKNRTYKIEFEKQRIGIELTYKNGNVKTTIELYVSINPNIDKTDKYDFIISYGDLRMLTNRRKSTKGIYEMTFKRTTTNSVTDNN